MRRGRSGRRGRGEGVLRNSASARATAAMYKRVTAKCYGSDITRKKKLLEKQRRGQGPDGNVSIPQAAVIATLQVGEE